MGISREIAILSAALVLGGCASGSRQIDSATPVTINPTQTEVIHKIVRAALKDPESARFGNIAAAANKAGAIQVCGLVNARNSYGGYTGMTLYIGEFSGNTFKLEGMGDEYVVLCDERGLRPPRT